jgi:ribose 5-phosphate isomerase A
MRAGSSVEDAKRRAGEAAAQLVEPGMFIGLGSGSTARAFVEALGVRVGAGLQITAVATSSATATLATSVGITLMNLDRPIDLAIDGADAIERSSLTALKGLGGALVREKIVAHAARRFVLIGDEGKVAGRLMERAGKVPLPVEVLPFGWPETQRRLASLGVPQPRHENGRLYLSDNGNYILDLHDCDYQDPERLGNQIKAMTGVVDHGLFVGLASSAIIADASGVTVLNRG